MKSKDTGAPATLNCSDIYRTLKHWVYNSISLTGDNWVVRQSMVEFVRAQSNQ